MRASSHALSSSSLLLLVWVGRRVPVAVTVTDRSFERSMHQPTSQKTCRTKRKVTHHPQGICLQMGFPTILSKFGTPCPAR